MGAKSPALNTKEGHMLRGLQNRVLKRMSGAKKAEKTAKWNFHKFYFSPKSRKVACLILDEVIGFLKLT
jgi:glutathione peroxidase-family protein